MWFVLFIYLFIYLKLRRRRQRQRQKAMSLVGKTTTLHVHHAFLYIFLPSLHEYDVKWPNVKLFWGRERQGVESEPRCGPLSSAPT